MIGPLFKGIEAWLVEDHSRPILSLQFGFDGGNRPRPRGQARGCDVRRRDADEGAGEISFRGLPESPGRPRGQDGHQRVLRSRNGILFRRSPRTAHESFKLLRLALTSPHFSAKDVERIREQLVATLRVEEKDPNKVASLEWHKLAFGAHPYARPTNGTLESVAAITADDLRDYVKRIFARDNLKVAAVGDIDAAKLGDLLDTVFGDLPAKSDKRPVQDFSWQDTSKQRIVTMPNPQSVVQFGFQGLKRKDPDFIAAYILNYVVGGGGFSSKLMQEVREKRGLAYSVYTYLYPLDHVGVFAGGVATENKSVGQSLDLIKEELDHAAKEGLTEKELRTAKDYLIGSFALKIRYEFEDRGAASGHPA